MIRVTRTVFRGDDAEAERNCRMRSSADFAPTSSLHSRPVVRQRPICPVHAPVPATVAEYRKVLFCAGR
jgi:hypothetical protein